jgi:ATP-dependent phosphofructokinase / diphosphate-dependent phosphofructokinase
MQGLFYLKINSSFYKFMIKHIGVLTAGGDSPGLNAAIRGLGKAAVNNYHIEVTGFKDGFRGILENRFMRLDKSKLSGILTIGGTILGTSREKPHKMPVGDKTEDMTGLIVENYRKHKLDALVCIGGGGTQKNAYILMQKGLNIITLPKTIDNDIPMTDISFGFDTAMGIGVDAIDRLHSTAHSHHRLIVVELMGHHSGWLALGAGLAGGADVILIPEIPYDIDAVAQSILSRVKKGSGFSIIAVAEGAISKKQFNKSKEGGKHKKDPAGESNSNLLKEPKKDPHDETGHSLKLARQLEKLTSLESRVSILGHLQRGGTPSAVDRLLATRLGTACMDYIAKGKFGIMVASKGEGATAVPLEKIIGKRKIVPLDHPWIQSARDVGTCLGD